MNQSEEQKRKMTNRLKRAEGQIRGVQKMIQQDDECIDIVTQLSAVRSSVDRMIGMIVAENLKDCLENPSDSIENQSKKIEKAIQLIVKK
ncbi:metal-sensitive transcriptional regulator [Marinilactibacillus sp. XAAS-LB27]|uniref:metal-sensitive transcriptional regulator n=1 Tax=Marinilactibacillus sp. XAAS-LB27 TaxID=3114538 RepID=UPI002E182E45|nr:metal-sensitive transcriptional regulator [Marinilactibacillus sp. XAAS-LB27]